MRRTDPALEWYRLDVGDAKHVHPAAHECWVHPSGASLILLWEAIAGHPGIGCWTWELRIEDAGECLSQCYRDPVPAPFEWAKEELRKRQRLNESSSVD